MFKYLRDVFFQFRRTIQIIICCQIPMRFLFSVYFPHPVGIVISSKVKIAKKVVIYQNVTIGGKYAFSPNIKLYPKISDNVIIYPGSVIVGGITVGNNTVIGANSFVSHDVPANSIVIGFNQIRKRNTCIGYIETDK